MERICRFRYCAVPRAAVVRAQTEINAGWHPGYVR